MKNLIFFLIGVSAGALASLFITDFSFVQGFAEAVLLSLVTAGCSFFLDFAFRPGNIFAFWMKFIDKYFLNNERNPFSFLHGPLGGCAYCQNIWISFAASVMGILIFGLSWLWILPIAFFSHLILFFLFKHFDLEA